MILNIITVIQINYDNLIGISCVTDLPNRKSKKQKLDFALSLLN